jgi:molybdopterin biosynthesis enzyme
MVPVPQAMQIILDQCKPMVQTATTNVDRDLIGSIAADDVYAAVEVPAFDASFVDGYAVRGKPISYKRVRNYKSLAPIDINCELLVTHDPLKLLMSTEGHLQYAVRITTGSIVPNEANAIVMVEDTELVEQAVSDGAEMRIRIVPGAQSPNPGDFVRRRGSDISRGSKVSAVYLHSKLIKAFCIISCYQVDL